MEQRCRSGHSEFRIYGEQRIPYGGVQEAYVRPQFPHKFENLETHAGYSQRDRRPILLPGHRIKPDVRKIAPDDRQLTSTLSSRLPTVFPAAEARRRGAMRCGAVRCGAVRSKEERRHDMPVDSRGTGGHLRPRSSKRSVFRQFR
jgi:hypothetical protein